MYDERSEFNPEEIQLVSLEHAAALAERCVGREALLQLLAKSFHIDAPLWQHAVLPFLAPSALFSPNFDSLIEEGWRLHAANAAVGRLRPHYRDENEDATPHIPLYKPHGTLERLYEPVGEGGLLSRSSTTSICSVIVGRLSLTASITSTMHASFSSATASRISTLPPHCMRCATPKRNGESHGMQFSQETTRLFISNQSPSVT